MTFSSKSLEWEWGVYSPVEPASQTLGTLEDSFLSSAPWFIKCGSASVEGEDIGPGRLLVDVVMGSCKHPRKAHSSHALTERHALCRADPVLAEGPRTAASPNSFTWLSRYHLNWLSWGTLSGEFFTTQRLLTSAVPVPLFAPFLPSKGNLPLPYEFSWQLRIKFSRQKCIWRSLYVHREGVCWVCSWW